MKCTSILIAFVTTFFVNIQPAQAQVPHADDEVSLTLGTRGSGLGIVELNGFFNRGDVNPMLGARLLLDARLIELHAGLQMRPIGDDVAFDHGFGFAWRIAGLFGPTAAIGYGSTLGARAQIETQAEFHIYDFVISAGPIVDAAVSFHPTLRQRASVQGSLTAAYRFTQGFGAAASVMGGTTFSSTGVALLATAQVSALYAF